MLEQCNKEPRALAMYDELTERLIRRSTYFRIDLEPGIKVTITLRHLASGAKYRDLWLARM